MHTQRFPLAWIVRSAWFLAFMIAVLLTQYSEVSAGPFGLKMGMSMEVLEQKCGIKQSGDSRNVFIAERVPSPHPQLETYMLVVDEKLGLCKIIAITGRIETSVYGDQLKGQFDALEKALISKYGTNKRFDNVGAGSIWKEPQHWIDGAFEEGTLSGRILVC
jgi:hypothetical protein